MRSRKCFGDEIINDSGISVWIMNTAGCIGESASTTVLKERLGNAMET